MSRLTKEQRDTYDNLKVNDLVEVKITAKNPAGYYGRVWAPAKVVDNAGGRLEVMTRATSTYKKIARQGYS